MNFRTVFGPVPALLIGGAIPLLAAPANDNFANATTLPTALEFTSAGTLIGATMEAAEPFAQYDYTSSVWWRWTPAQSGRVILETSNPGLDTAMAIFIGDSLTDLAFAAYGEDIQPPDQLNSRIRLTVVAGETYYVAVFGYDGGAAFNLTGATIASAPPNDSFASAAELPAELPAVATGTNRGATVEAYERFHADEIGGASVWWRWTAPVSTNVSLSTAGSSFDTLLAVYQGTDVSYLTEVVSNDEAAVGISSSLVKFKAVAGTTYYIAVDGYDTALGDVKLTLQPQAPEKAHAWTLRDVDGNLVSSAEFAGKVVLLNFWATWCGPCVAEIPDLIELQETYGPQGLAIIGISSDRDSDYVGTVRNFMAAKGVNYQVVLSEDSGVDNFYGGIEYIPTTFIIDRDGNITDKFVSRRDKAVFEAAILPLLAAPPAPPALAIALTELGAALSWPDEGDLFVLQTSASLSGGWEPVQGAPEVIDGRRSMSVNLATGGYFRLAPR